jgi:DNA-binding NarL/FixJ family response regulator
MSADSTPVGKGVGFMSIVISSALSTLSAPAPNSPTNTPAPQQVQQVQQPVGNSGDTVTLTEAQQVYNLYDQGQSVSQIATSLSLTVSMVNNYLGITQSG